MPVLIGSFDVQNLKIQIIKFFPFLLPAKIMVLKGNFPTKILTNMNEPYHRTTIVTPAWDIICVKKEEIKNIFDNMGLHFLLKVGKSRILFDKME